MSRDTPQQRRSSAMADIVGLNSEIKYLSGRLSQARKERRAAYAKFDRAIKAIERVKKF